MLRRRIPESTASSQPTSVVSQCERKQTSNRAWPRRLGAVMLCMLGLTSTLQSVMPPEATAEPAGFAQNCSGFAQDALLGALWPGVPEQGVLPRQGVEKGSTALTAMVPRLSLHGTALATYEPRKGAPAAATLEAVFGIAPGAHRQIVETPFSQDSRAVVLHPNVLATVAHALTPDVVEVHVAQQASVHTVPLRVTSMTVRARTAPDEEGVPAQVAHVNAQYDLALVQADKNQILQALPYPAVLSYGTGDPEKPTGGLLAGDCIAALVTSRTDKTYDTGQDRLVLGKVLAKVPVATNAMTQTKLNVNMFTTDLAVQPGDSGSPVLALRAGRPVLIGLVSATMYPTAAFTYVARIDPLLALADALKFAASQPGQPLLVQSADAPGQQ